MKYTLIDAPARKFTEALTEYLEQWEAVQKARDEYTNGWGDTFEYFHVDSLARLERLESEVNAFFEKTEGR